jgi:histidyl-tRNA synthetase
VFEVVSPELGEDTVICGGGRYDRLISDLGGPQVAGVGFAIGEDRLIDVLPEAFREQVLGRRPVAVLPLDDGAAAAALAIVRALAVRGVAAQAEVTGRSLKAGLKWAAKLGARMVVIVGGDELAAGVVVLRDLDRGEQQAVPIAEVADRFARTGES